MKRLWALIIVVVIVAAAIPTYWVLTRPSHSSQCSGGGGSPPLAKPLGPPTFAVAYNNSAKVGNVWWFNFTLIEDSGVPTAIGQMTLQVVTEGTWTPVTGAIEFLVWNYAHTVVAIANGTTSNWTEGASLPLQSFSTVTVVTASTFPFSTGLMATMPGPCGGSSSIWSAFGA